MTGIGFDFDRSFEEMLAYFRQKGYAISAESWRDVWKQAHARAFTVARITAIDVLEDIRKELDTAMASGATLEDFKANLIPLLEKSGWWAPPGQKGAHGRAPLLLMPDGTERKRLTGYRLNTIYGANMASAYQVGRYKQMSENTGDRPYWQYMTVRDAAVRPAHAALHGRVYSWDHPFWDTWYPPNGFNCRCYVKALTAGQVKARGLTVWKDIPTLISPDPGWDYNVGKAGLDAWQPDLSKYSPAAQAALAK